MTQVVSPTARPNRKAPKLSLVCLVFFISLVALLLILIFYTLHLTVDVKRREEHSSPLQLQDEPLRHRVPPPRARRQRRPLDYDLQSYMKTGKKPAAFDPNFSQRHIEGNAFEYQHDQLPADSFAKTKAKWPHSGNGNTNEHNPPKMPKKLEVEDRLQSTTVLASSTTRKVHRTHFYEDAQHAEKESKQDQNQNLVPPHYVPTTLKHQHQKDTADTESLVVDHPIHYLNLSQVSMQDTFSASWLQRRQEFMDMPLDKVMICEDAAWEAWEDRPEKLRMTLDYMDFSVEHLSKWWKFMSFYKTQVAYDTIIRVLEQYMWRGIHFHTLPEQQRLLSNTLAVIAFQPYQHKHQQEKHYNLTVTSLAATLESIRRAQMGRAVVVGLVDNGSQIAQDAFAHLLKHLPHIRHQTDTHGKIRKIGHLEVAYARGSAEIARSKHLEKNIPRAVLYGTRLALQLGDKLPQHRADNETEYITEWLGEGRAPQYWKYVYLTEPDTLLNMRRSAVAPLKQQLDQGNILAPHRLQPIPHESDLKGLNNKLRYLNLENGWDQVWQIDPATDVCCDEHKGPNFKPGKTNYSDCGTWWYMCGFKKDYNDKSLGDVHERLRGYQLMKVKGGTGLTLLAGNLFGRRCFPAQHTVCTPPPPIPGVSSEIPSGKGWRKDWRQSIKKARGVLDDRSVAEEY